MPKYGVQDLREYQKTGIRFLRDKGKAILADQPGLGKTAQALIATHLRHELPCVVCAPKGAIGVWCMEVANWFGLRYRVAKYVGQSYKRNKQLTEALAADFVVTTYKSLPELMRNGLRPRAIICDEYHVSGLISRKSKMCEAMTSIVTLPDIKTAYFLTGTPMRKGPQDFWPILHMINPYRFKSYWSFVNKWCIQIKNPFGREILPRPSDIEGFRDMLKEYVIRRSKKTVLTQLPSKTRQAIPVEMSSQQSHMYNQMLEQMLVEYGNSDFVLAPNSAVKCLRLRQILVSPRLIDPGAELGAGVEALVDLCEEEWAEGRPVVVFTPFVAAVELLENVLGLHCDVVCKVHGKMSADNVTANVKLFQESTKPRRVLICTISSGSAFTAHAASTAIFLGLEWADYANIQAEDRIHRLGQTEPVFIKYILNEESIDQHVLEIVSGKNKWNNIVLKADALLAHER